MSKILKVKTGHSVEIKILFDVLKDVLHEFKMNFIQDVENNNAESSDKKNKQKEPVSESDNDIVDDSDNDDGKKKKSKKGDDKKKKPSKKPAKKNKKNKDDSESESDDGKDKKKTSETEKKQSIGGIKILELDEHQTLLIYVKLNASQFVEFYVKYPEYSVGLDLVELHKFLKTIDRDSILTMYVDKDDEQNMVFQTKNDVKPSTGKYKQKLMDLDDVNKKLPKQTNFEILVTMDTADFHRLCREMHQFSDYVEITCTGKELKFTCQGDNNSFTKSFDNSDKCVRIICLNTNTKKPVIVQAIYELRYLVTFGKCVNLCSEMQLYLRNDYPIFIHYTVATLGKMLIGLTPVDEKAIKKGNDYDEEDDKFYEETKKVVLKK